MPRILAHARHGRVLVGNHSWGPTTAISCLHSTLTAESTLRPIQLRALHSWAAHSPCSSHRRSTAAIMSGIDIVDAVTTPPGVDGARPSFVSPRTILQQSRQRQPSKSLSALEREQLDGLVRRTRWTYDLSLTENHSVLFVPSSKREQATMCCPSATA